jgi:hypothetical protein
MRGGPHRFKVVKMFPPKSKSKFKLPCVLPHVGTSFNAQIIPSYHIGSSHVVHLRKIGCLQASFGETAGREYLILVVAKM